MKKHDWNAAPEFSYFEQDHLPDGTRTYRVTMMLGSPYRELVAVNGQDLPPDGVRRQQQLMESARSRRMGETPPQRAKRVEKYQQARKRDGLFLDQFPKAFRFTWVGQKAVDKHDVYVLKATPKPGYQPPVFEARALKGMEGELWVDTETFQWVKVQAKVVHPVNIAGFLARVAAGTSFALNYAPAGDGVWLPTRYVMRAHVRVLALFPLNRSADETFSGYAR